MSNLIRSNTTHRLRPATFWLSLLAALLFAPAAQAATASWSFSPSSYDFGMRLPEEGRSEKEPFVLTNSGSVALEPALVSLVSEVRRGFELRGDDCHTVLQPGEDCEVGVSFDPTSAGQDQATLEVSERNSSVPPAVATVKGTGAAPVVGIDPPELAFGSMPVGPAPPPKSVTVTNRGPGNLHFSGVSLRLLSGSGREPFQFTSIGCQISTVLPPGGTCSVSVAFGPGVAGTDVGELTIADNAADSPQTVELSGTVEPEPPFPAPAPPSAATLTLGPDHRTKARSATFAFSGDASTVRFQCRLGGGPLVSTCRSPVHYRLLKPGRHQFSVRPVGGDGVPGPVLTYRWRILRQAARKGKHLPAGRIARDALLHGAGRIAVGRTVRPRHALHDLVRSIRAI